MVIGNCFDLPPGLGQLAMVRIQSIGCFLPHSQHTLLSQTWRLGITGSHLVEPQMSDHMLSMFLYK